jgi:hypothetical protein
MIIRRGFIKQNRNDSNVFMGSNSLSRFDSLIIFFNESYHDNSMFTVHLFVTTLMV